jgi:type IV pilus assembly protein PilA
MLNRIRKMARHDEGFTLIELMVVILIIGILMAIAIPSFLAVRNRGYASAAKSMRSNAVKAMELYAVDNQGSYLGADNAALKGLEPSLNIVAGTANAITCELVPATATTYSITVTDAQGSVYTAVKAANAAVVLNPV